MNIYLARSIRGAERTDTAFVHALKKYIETLGHHTQFDIPVEITRIGRSNDEYIYLRDIMWLDRCEAMVAEVSSPSLGVGYEIAYAKHMCEIPIFAVAEKDANVSAMIRGSLDVFEYRDIAHLTAYLGVFMAGIHA